MKRQIVYPKKERWKESRNRAGRSSSSRRSTKETDEVGSENPLGRWVGCRPDRVVENRHWCQEKDGLSERPRKGGGRGHRAGSAGIRDIKYEMMIIPAV